MMELENRYLVIKQKDIESILSPSEKIRLACMADKINESRKSDGRDLLKCVVIESDWPEYQAARTVLLSRIRHEQSRYTLAKGIRLEVLPNQGLAEVGTKGTILHMAPNNPVFAICKLDGTGKEVPLPLSVCKIIGVEEG